MIHGFTPMVGVELEFYYFGDIEVIKNAIKYQDTMSISKEEGYCQYECVFLHRIDIENLIDSILNFISISESLGADFSAKLSANQPGSAMNINISLYNNGNNMFDMNRDLLYFSIGGLLHNMKKCMKYFANNDHSYARFSNADIHTPNTISWGINNRTTALRIPVNGESRIEHRVPCSDSDPYSVIYSILYGINYGISNQILPSTKIYGRAHDKQYDLEKLPESLSHAMKY